MHKIKGQSYTLKPFNFLYAPLVRINTEENCELHRFCGPILFDEKGRILHHLKRRLLEGLGVPNQAINYHLSILHMIVKSIILSQAITLVKIIRG